MNYLITTPCGDCCRPTRVDGTNEYRGRILCDDCYDFWRYEDQAKRRIEADEWNEEE